MAHERTELEIWEGLESQCEALSSSCLNYDRGKKWEATRIASSVHVLVHDFGRTKSILSQLGLKDSIKFLSQSSGVYEENLIACMPLVYMTMGMGRFDFEPVFKDGHEDNNREMSFAEWWERDPIYRAGKGKKLVYRKNLVFAMRNQDGGSHFDGTLTDEDYYHMKCGGGWIFASGGVETEPMGLQSATMRQLGWELLQSLDKAGLIKAT